MDERVVVSNVLNDSLIWSESFVRPTTEELYETILDRRIVEKGGYIILPVRIISSSGIIYPENTKFPIPKEVSIPSICECRGENWVYLNSLQKKFNSLVKATEAVKINGVTPKIVSWITSLVDLIIQEMYDSIGGKNGILRSLVYYLPIPFSGRATATERVELDPNSVRIPANFMVKWLTNEEFRALLSIPLEMSIKDAMSLIVEKQIRIVVGRQPSHTLSNLMAFKISGYSKRTIEIHPGIFPMMHGDFDGDQCWMGFIPNITESMYMENHIKDFFDPPKEYSIYGYKVNTYEDLVKMFQKVMNESRTGLSIDPFVDESYQGYRTNQYFTGISEDEFLEADAAYTFATMKDGVATAGGLGNLILFLSMMTSNNKKEHKYITMFRHELAQEPLDTKRGRTSDEPNKNLNELQDIMYRKTERIRDIYPILDKINTTDEAKKAFISLIERIEGFSVDEIFDKLGPTMKIRNGAKINQLSRVIEEITKLYSIGE